MVYLPHWPIPSTLGNKKIDYETVFERMEIVLKKLNNPHQKLPAIIHISGTNGKGSTASLIAQIFKLNGYKIHLYTSPHLIDCNERILLDGEKISDNFLFEILEETRIAAAGTDLTFMEAFTIGAFLAFSKVEADVLVLECGMGCRIDATNIVPEKIASVITPISFDHSEYLGNSIERIALEKAMIIKPDTPLIVASQPSEAKKIIKILAEDQKIDSYFYDDDFQIFMDEESGEFDFYFKDIFFESLPKPNLSGMHQYINFATAITTCLAQKKFTINQDAIRSAISTVKWRSRLEKINNHFNQFLKNAESEIWIDGAHNEAGAFALAKWLEEKNNFDEKIIIVGFSRNKCKRKFLEKFLKFSEIVALRVNGEPYPEEPEVIAKIALEINIVTHCASNLLDAIYYISQKYQNKKICIVICGSLHLARDVNEKYSK